MAHSRRAFLAGLGCSVLSSAARVTGVDPFLLQLPALAPPKASGASDYKALVCIFLTGGNDANNMVIPVDDYALYAAVRGGSPIEIPQAVLLPITPSSLQRAFGLHPALAELHGLWSQQKVGIVVNVGTLIRPITREEYSDPRLRPFDLRSHAAQQSQWQTSYANGPYPTGWGGRAADATQVDASGLPTNVSVSGTTIFSRGRRAPLVLSPAPASLGQFLRLRRASDAAEESPLRTLIQADSADGSPTLVQEAARISDRAIRTSVLLATDPVLKTPFPDTSLGNQLKQIAKLISVRNAIGIHRQVFFASIGGFDTHSNQGGVTGNHANLLRQLSEAMAAFYAATVEIGASEQVTTFTKSEFNRTFSTFSGGTEHSWGGHHFVVGDAVNGGDFYGRYPTLLLDGPDDIAFGGQWLPTTSVDQYAATLARWFGVAETDLRTVFPNIHRFPAADLGFMRHGTQVIYPEPARVFEVPIVLPLPGG